jgi:hypothetical protein
MLHLNTKLINVSNHPSRDWSDTQRGMYIIQDVPFPQVACTRDGAFAAAKSIVESVIAESKGDVHKPTVHIMGELGAVILAVTELKKLGYSCVHSMTERVAVMDGDTKTSKFIFKGFREYFPSLCTCGKIATIGSCCDSCFGKED